MAFFCLECRCSKSTLLEQYFFIPCGQVDGLILFQKMEAVAKLWPGAAQQREILRASKGLESFPRLIQTMN